MQTEATLKGELGWSHDFSIRRDEENADEQERRARASVFQVRKLRDLVGAGVQPALESKGSANG